MIADFIDPSNEIPRGSNVVASTANRFLKLDASRNLAPSGVF